VDLNGKLCTAFSLTKIRFAGPLVPS